MAAYFSLGTPGSTRSQNPTPEEEEQQQQYHQFYHNNWASLYRPIPGPSPTRGFQLWHPFVELNHPSHPGGDRSGSGNSSGMNCQDCGNKAKKDCKNLRCRSCCNSRGFDCPTHVKSTWVPAAKRRERHHHQEDLRRRQIEIEVEEEEEEKEAKRDKMVIREYNENLNRDNQTIHPNTNSKPGLEMALNSLPPEVNSSAMFRCVKVTSTTEVVKDQFAYQTSINIGGRLFKGILYDHGPDIKNNINFNIVNPAESSSGGSGSGGNHLFAATTTTTTSTIGDGAMVDTNDNRSFIYPTINAFMAGTQFLFPSSTGFKS